MCSEIYKFLKKRHQNNNSIERFSNLAFLLVNNDKYLDIPKKVIVSAFKGIPPYLNSVAVKYGQYFDVFESVGCSKTGSASHCLASLSEMKRNVGEKLLDINSKQKALILSYYVGQFLQREKEPKLEGPLYLPTVNFDSPEKIGLTDSTQVIVVDDFSLESRLKKFTEPLAIFKYGTIDKQDETNTLLIKYLPDELKPKSLRSAVTEGLIENEIVVEQNPGTRHASKTFHKKIRSKEYLNGLKRLIKHEGINTNEDMHFIDACMKKIEVVVCLNLQTRLLFNGDEIPESRQPVQIFPVMKDDVLVIYFSKEATNEADTRTSITQALLKLLRDPLKKSESILYFDAFLEYNTSDISGFLDKKNILKEDSGASVRESGNSPPLGEAIPVDLHGNLRNDLSRNLDPDEFVGYDESGTGKFIVYAKIVNIDEVNDRYDIKISDKDEDDLLLAVPRSKLHKFDRSYEKNAENRNVLSNEPAAENAVAVNEQVPDDYTEENKERSYEEIVQEIRRIVREMRSQDEEEQKRVKRRLFLTWHPDKHPNKGLATMIFQFIQNELDLGRDFTENHEQWRSDASNHHRSRNKYNDDFRTYFQRSSSHTSQDRSQRPQEGFFYRFKEKNPQPAEARRWYRQAEFDLRMAKRTIEMSDPKSYEWICYMAFQVKYYSKCSIFLVGRAFAL